MFPDSGSWSFKDKTQTANDSAGQASASCPAHKGWLSLGPCALNGPVPSP